MQDVKKTIKLCGIGNGILDMQYLVSEEDFEKIGVPKSEMRLVDLTYHRKLFEQLAHLTPRKSPGGSTGNTIDAFAKFGGSASLLVAVGSDKNGQFYYDELEKHNINYKKNIIDNDLTGTSFVLITPDGERTMLTALSASSHFSEEHLSEELIASSEWLYIENYMFSEINAASAINKSIEIAKKHNTKIALSASDVFIIDICQKDFLPALEKTDLLFCNENEAVKIASLISKNIFDTENKNNILSYIFNYFPNLNIVMTSGASGASIKFKNQYFDIAAEPADVIDTTGAGDSFAGAFLYGMIYLNNLEKAARLASLLSAKVISQLGARYEGSFDDILNIL